MQFLNTRHLNTIHLNKRAKKNGGIRNWFVVAKTYANLAKPFQGFTGYT
jgi:hypothetical protein